MDHGDFKIGTEFWCGVRRYRCTDVGTRVIVAIRVDGADLASSDGGPVTRFHLDGPEAERQGWFNGPPYAVLERVFDENDLEVCGLERDEEQAVGG